MSSHRENPQAAADITSDWATFNEEVGMVNEVPSLEKLNEDVDLLFHVTSKMLGDTNGGNDSICNICKPVYNGNDPTPVKFDVPERVQPPCSRRCSDWTNIKNKEHIKGKAHEKFREAGRDAAAATPYLGGLVAAGNAAARAYGLYRSANPTTIPSTARKATMVGFGDQEYNQRAVQSEVVGGKSRRKRKSKSRKSRRKRKSKSRRKRKSKSRKSRRNKRNKR